MITIGETICGDVCKSYLLSLKLSEREIEAIMEGVHNPEWKYTTLAIDHQGRVIDWDQYKEAPLGEISKSIARRIAQTHRHAFRLELFEHKPPDCITLKDKKGALGLLGPFSRGFEL